MQQLLTGKKRLGGFSGEWKEIKFNDLFIESRVKGNNGFDAIKITVKLYGKGVFAKNEKLKGSPNTQYYFRKAGQFIYSKLDFLNGAFGVVPDELDGYESTLDLPCFDVLESKVSKSFFLYFVSREAFYKRFDGGAIGGRKAKRIQVKEFLAIKMTFPQLKYIYRSRCATQTGACCATAREGRFSSSKLINYWFSIFLAFRIDSPLRLIL